LSKKIYVLDTNVLLSAGNKALTSFEDNEVVIPFVVVEELEKKRLEDGMVGGMARYALREIEKLRSKGKLKDGVKVNSQGGILRVEMNHRNATTLPAGFENDKSNDIRVLTVAHNLFLEEKEKREKGDDARDVILLTNDLPLRIKADAAFEMEIQPFWFHGSLFRGFREVLVPGKVIDELYAHKNKPLDAPKEVIDAADDAANHAFILKSNTNPSHVASALYSNGKLRHDNLENIKSTVTGRAAEQKVALRYLFDDNKSIVSLGGPAGTGKTLLSMVAAIDQTMNEATHGKHQFRKITVIRPLYAVGGQELGFLPGSEDEKMAPWKKAIFESMEGIIPSVTLKALQDDDKLNVIPATFLRGRTFHDTFTIVDEAQNFDPTVLLTILSRLGENSKIVFLWDATQKDNLNIGYNDGIVSVVEKLKSYDTFAHIALTKSERSPVAQIAGKILEDYIH
jgi:PhoH-like ATPase